MAYGRHGIMKFSVITATVDRDPALLATLGSVAAQTFTDYEQVIVDGVASRDGAIADGFPHARRLYHEPHGVYDAINCGIAHSEGDIIGILHGNDRLASPRILENIASAFDADPGLDFVYGNIQYLSPHSLARKRVYRSGHFEPGDLERGIAPPHPSLYIRREAMERIGPYDTQYAHAADFDLWIRLFNDKSLRSRFMPMIFAYMPLGGLSSTLRSRLFVNNSEKLRSLRANGLRANPLALIGKYLSVIKDIIGYPPPKNY